MQHGVAIGALIATCFGLGWAIAGVQGVPSRWRLAVLGIAILISLLISTGILWGLRSHPHLVSGSGPFQRADLLGVCRLRHSCYPRGRAYPAMEEFEGLYYANGCIHCWRTLFRVGVRNRWQ